MIGQTHAAAQLAYMASAKALTMSQGMAGVWADYLNAETPDPDPVELEAATRRAIREWATKSRAWQIDVERYAAAIRANRRERLEAYIAERGQVFPAGLADEPAAELAWRRAWQRAVSRGQEDPEVAAWEQIGRKPPPPQLPAPGTGGSPRDMLTRLAAEHAATLAQNLSPMGPRARQNVRRARR